jgi:AcrR family transcriptional regulator
VLEQVASEAGYTRGALYHHFKDKEDLTLSAVRWAFEEWKQEVGFDRLVGQEREPVGALIELARRHAVYCRRDVARLVMALRLEFSGQDHPVGREVERIYETIVVGCASLIKAGRRAGSIPPGPPARAVALALVGAVEGAMIQLVGLTPHDELLAIRTATGVLGLNRVAADPQAADS